MLREERQEFLLLRLLRLQRWECHMGRDGTNMMKDGPQWWQKKWAIVGFWIYFEGRANMISWWIECGHKGNRIGKDESQMFGVTIQREKSPRNGDEMLWENWVLEASNRIPLWHIRSSYTSLKIISPRIL